MPADHMIEESYGSDHMIEESYGADHTVEESHPAHTGGSLAGTLYHALYHTLSHALTGALTGTLTGALMGLGGTHKDAITPRRIEQPKMDPKSKPSELAWVTTHSANSTYMVDLNSHRVDHRVRSQLPVLSGLR